MKDPISARSKIYRLVMNALFVALYVILGTYLSFKIPGAVQISLSTVPILLCAFLFSPVDAVTVAVLGTFLEQILDPSPYGFMTLPMWLIPGAMLALVAALGAMRVRQTENRRAAVLLTVVTVVCAEVLLTALNTCAMYIDGHLLGYSVKALHLLLPTRVLNCLVRMTISCVLCLALVPPLRRQLTKMQILK
ncbi:MAG: folate family ECF transporter S component [Clostridia bacterium]|nr:folate family ECF transporter S component [Clostridia bacterium]